jgi:biotin transport system ATP-binding protein
MSPPPSTPAIVLENAGLVLAGRAILSSLTARLDAPRIGIVGQNGSGKSTLARMLTGLVTPTTGRVTLAGIDPAKDRKAAIGQIGLLFQNPDHQILFPTVTEELEFGLRQLGQGRAQAATGAAAILARFGRGHWAKLPVHTLSQGQRHLLCLLAVLAMEPAVLVLDEPFSGLDIPTQRQLTRILASLPQRVVTITHDPQMLTGYDRVLWLDAGRIRAEGPSAPILAAFTAEMERLGAADPDCHHPAAPPRQSPAEDADAGADRTC